MKMNRMAVCGQLLALGWMFTGCVDEADVDDGELAQEEETGEGADEVEERNLCLYSATPPATDDSDSVIGAVDDVESEDASNGGCDLHMFRVTANPPADRIRTVHFSAFSSSPIDEVSARLWTKSCAGGLGGLCATNFSTSAVSVTTGGGCSPGPCIYCPPVCFYTAEGTAELSASNSVADLRAGMRALDEDGDPIVVDISVSE
jgi:hypothetical protein